MASGKTKAKATPKPKKRSRSTSRAAKRRKADEQPPSSQPIRVAAPAAGVSASVILGTASGDVARIDYSPRLDQIAMTLCYRVRNRIRWNTNERGRRAQAKECRKIVAALGLSRENLEDIAERGIVEVSIPFTDEQTGWAFRILPWEYLLSGATHETRKQSGDKPLTIVRHLNCVGARPPESPAGTVAVVVSAPGAISEMFDFSNERRLAPKRLKPKKCENLDTPTLDKLRLQIEKMHPEVIHLGGVDTHQGAELLEQSDDVLDGMMLSDGHGGARAVFAQPLAAALNAGGSSPSLVVFNIYHSGGRTAAMAVAEGAGAALGFQDTFDDLDAERFIGAFYRGWAATKGNALVAFQAGWKALAESHSLTGSGIVLWSAKSLVHNLNVEDVQTKVDSQYAEVEKDRSEIVIFKDAATAKANLTVECDPLICLNYSLLHNRRPLFKRFVLRKALECKGTIANVKIEVELAAGSMPQVYRATETVSDLTIDMTSKVFIPLTSQLARTIEESLDTGLSIKVCIGEHVIYEKPQRVTLLPINEWVDDDATRQFLPSFVWPLDPAVRRVIAAAQPYLRALTDDPSAGFDGYQCVDPDLDEPTLGVDRQVAAIWRALLDLELGYINPPPSYSVVSQRLRTPSKILEGGRGTCIDLALLMAACLEYVDIYPVIFLLDGHAFPGYWRSEEEWEDFAGLKVDADGDGSGDKAEQPVADLGGTAWLFPTSTEKRVRKSVYQLVRDQIEGGHLVALESVWLTTNRSFQDAMDDGWDNLSNPSEFCCLIDLKLARTAEPPVTPLPLTGVAVQ